VRKKRGCLIEKKKRNWEKMVLTAEKKKTVAMEMEHLKVMHSCCVKES
jgi:ribosomal protein L21E